MGFGGSFPAGWNGKHVLRGDCAQSLRTLPGIPPDPGEILVRVHWSTSFSFFLAFRHFDGKKNSETSQKVIPLLI